MASYADHRLVALHQVHTEPDGQLTYVWECSCGMRAPHGKNLERYAQTSHSAHATNMVKKR